MGSNRMVMKPPLLLLLLLLLLSIWARVSFAKEKFWWDRTVLELDDGFFKVAMGAIDYLIINFYVIWCGHYKRHAPELDEAAPILAGLSEPIMIDDVFKESVHT